MNLRIILLLSICISSILHAVTTFDEINVFIEEKKYTNALHLLETTHMSNITKKRALIQLAQEWPHLSKQQKKRFDQILEKTMPATQRNVEEIRLRYTELAEDDHVIEPEPQPKQTPKPKSPAPTQKQSPVKQQQKTPTAKKPQKRTEKKTYQHKQKPVTEQKNVQELEWNVREEL